MRRLRGGLGQLRGTLGSAVQPIQETWTGDHLDFQWRVLGQTASGGLDVADDYVRVEIELPWLLARLAGTAKNLLQKKGQLLLEKK